MNTARQLRIFVIGRFFCRAVFAASYPVKISSTNPRILVDQNNAPFLMVGDSPHSLWANLSSSNAAFYLADRAAHGINSLWVNLLCVRPVEGRPDGSLLDGTKPFTSTISGTNCYDLTTPNEAYFPPYALLSQLNEDPAHRAVAANLIAGNQTEELAPVRSWASRSESFSATAPQAWSVQGPSCSFKVPQAGKTGCHWFRTWCSRKARPSW